MTAPTLKPLARFASLRFGLALPWQAARLIGRTPPLLFWSAIPMGLTLVLYYYVIGSLIALAQGVLAASFVFLGAAPGGLVLWLLQALSNGVLLLVAALTFAFTSSVLASPFNDQLAAQAEKYAAPALPPVAPATRGRQVDLLLVDLAKAVATGTASVVALLVAWIPIVNLFSFAAAFQLVAFQYLSYPQTRRDIGLAPGALFLWRHAWACAGFGLTITVLFALPVVSSVALPVAVVAGTLLAARAPGGPNIAPLR